MHDNDVSIRRVPNAQASFPLLNEMIVERGDKTDWALLHELHYKCDGGLPAAVKYWKLTLRGETIGVLITSAPKPLLKERHQLFPLLKPGHDTKITNTYRFAWINKNMRVISRFVLDTQYRGLGAAYRFQNLVSRLEGNRYMEIQSSMSKYNYFAQKAGFKFVKPSNANKFDIGIKFFRRILRAHPADYEAIQIELAAMSEAARERTLAEMRDFYFRHSALEKTGSRGKGKEGRMDTVPMPKIIKGIQQMVLASPMYGIYTNPDYGRPMPDQLPLLAFDQQLPTEKLRDWNHHD